MTFRLLALDLDGTLLRTDHSVDPRDVAAIAELRAAGVAVTIVTGRLHSGAAAAARACAIDGAIACVEGSHIVDASGGETHARHPIGSAEVTLVRDAFEAHQLATFVIDVGGITHHAAGAEHADYVRTWSPNLSVVDHDAAWSASPLAAIAIGRASAVAATHLALRDHAAQIFSASFEVRDRPGTAAVLVRAAGPTKGTALAELCRLAGCSVDEAVAVGDWINDIPMFDVAGRSFCMAAAPPEVRAAATDLLDTAAGAGGGIAEAIRRAWG
jgi:Cof subfamily protein (haloacid dehalogenase superfamily)